jgi:hypothetical protein
MARVGRDRLARDVIPVDGWLRIRIARRGALCCGWAGYACGVEAVDRHGQVRRGRPAKAREGNAGRDAAGDEWTVTSTPGCAARGFDRQGRQRLASGDWVGLVLHGRSGNVRADGEGRDSNGSAGTDCHAVDCLAEAPRSAAGEARRCGTWRRLRRLRGLRGRCGLECGGTGRPGGVMRSAAGPACTGKVLRGDAERGTGRSGKVR